MASSWLPGLMGRLTPAKNQPPEPTPPPIINDEGPPPDIQVTDLTLTRASTSHSWGLKFATNIPGLVLTAARKGTPAESGGLAEGDRIIAIDGVDARSWTTERWETAMKKLTTVTLRVAKNATTAPRPPLPSLPGRFSAWMRRTRSS